MCLEAGRCVLLRNLLYNLVHSHGSFTIPSPGPSSGELVGFSLLAPLSAWPGQTSWVGHEDHRSGQAMMGAFSWQEGDPQEQLGCSLWSDGILFWSPAHLVGRSCQASGTARSHRWSLQGSWARPQAELDESRVGWDGCTRAQIPHRLEALAL